MTQDVPLAVGAAAVLAGYALGTIPTAHVVAGRYGIDPTVAGSRNPGATNVMRTAGKAAGAATVAGDVGKGMLAAGLGWALGGRDLAILCGVAAVLGHVAPVTRAFRGGKGVATGVGMTLVTFPLAALAGVAWFYAIRAVLGRPSVVCEMGIVTLPVVAAVSGATAVEVAALTGCAALIVQRLWSGRSSGEPARSSPSSSPSATEGEG